MGRRNTSPKSKRGSFKAKLLCEPDFQENTACLGPIEDSLGVGSSFETIMATD